MFRINSLLYAFRETKKMKIYKRPYYSGLPDFHKPHYVDVHESYQKRTKEQIRKQFQGLEFQVECTKHIYAPHETGADLKGRKAILTVDVKTLKLTHLQLLRFKLLVGPRFNEKTDKLKMVCEMYPEYQQNFQKAFEQLEQVIIEAKRAP